MFKEYIMENWPLILILPAFAISLFTNVFLDKKTKRRTLILIGTIFLLSIVVFLEFYFTRNGIYNDARVVLMAVRYSSTPIIAALVIFTLIKRQRWFIFLPAFALVILDVVSIWTGIVFGLNSAGKLQRGPLGFLPYIVAGLYLVFLVYLLIRRSNKQFVELIPIFYLAFAFAAGVTLPLFLGSDYAKHFCTTMTIALFVYHEFTVHEITKKDPLTGLLNRQAYYSNVSHDPESISALLSIDMNGLKTINDNEGHLAGDEALNTLATCFQKALRRNQTGYRLGGDEFAIICRKNTLDEVKALVARIAENVRLTKYTCSIGYSYNEDGKKSPKDLLRESDEMMYEAKARHYRESGIDRRSN